MVQNTISNLSLPFFFKTYLPDSTLTASKLTNGFQSFCQVKTLLLFLCFSWTFLALQTEKQRKEGKNYFSYLDQKKKKPNTTHAQLERVWGQTPWGRKGKLLQVRAYLVHLLKKIVHLL